MTCDVDVIVEDLRWTDAFDVGMVAERAARMAVARVGWTHPSEVSLLACSDDRIAGLNGQFRDKDSATNVLSWPAFPVAPPGPGLTPAFPDPDPTEDATFLGDIALAYQTCLREAELASKPLETHATHLIVHGILHLFGFDHETDADARLMEDLETKILAELGVSSPYG